MICSCPARSSDATELMLLKCDELIYCQFKQTKYLQHAEGKHIFLW